MFTATFECTYGTFIRLEFEKVYDGMLAAPITVHDLIVGEILWAGTKGFFFSFAVLCVLACFRIIHLPQALLAPLVGFLTGVMFSSLSLLVTSFVKTINHFNFFLTGFISPMFFFLRRGLPREQSTAGGALCGRGCAADARGATGPCGLHEPVSARPARRRWVYRRVHRGDRRPGHSSVEGSPDQLSCARSGSRDWLRRRDRT